MSGIEFKQAIHLTPMKDGAPAAGAGVKRSHLFLIFLLVAAAHVMVYTHLPESRRDGGWPNIVLRNWHDYGYWPMHGQLVANPGGLEAGEERFVYPGHRATFLIPVYWLKELPGGTFANGALYDLAVVAATFAAMIALFGANWRGVLLGTVVCFTPAFVNNIAAVDTISVPALLGIAAMSFAASRFARMQNDVSVGFAGLAVALVYMLLNWSTLFMLGIAAVYVFCKRTDWKSTAIFFVPPLIIGMIVLAISMHSKNGASAGAEHGAFWNSYLWGPLGYDRSGMSFSKAFVRISAVNGVAWFSLIIAGMVVVVVNGLADKWRRAIWPLLAGVAAVFALRNYNAHHPWNAVCEIGLGLLFSLELLTDSAPLAFPKWRRLATTGAVSFAVLYLLAVLALDHFNSRQAYTLRDLVVKNTPRHALIVVSGSLLPGRETRLEDFTELFDRKVIGADQFERQTNREAYLLTHDALPENVTAIAESRVTPSGTDKIIGPMFQFYREKISRRADGNRKEYFDDYRLGKY